MLGQGDSDRASAAYLSARSQGETLQVLRALGEAEKRVEALLDRLEAQTAQCERRLAQAVEQAERAAAVALELRQDVSSLISALQGLATEVDAQMRDHTAKLMAGLASAQAFGSQLPTATGEGRAVGPGAMEQGDRVGAPSGSSEPAGRARELPKHQPGPDRTSATGAADQRVLSIRDEFRVSDSSPGDGRYARAVQLAARGLEATEIARSCGLGKEEVRMLLRLRSRADERQAEPTPCRGAGQSREQDGG
ncbi:MAG: DUF2802 domain-containing protein [Anaerolineae bacterium]|nr:DUF2802 domain-containing protein [Anaerolineae bacterium]